MVVCFASNGYGYSVMRVDSDVVFLEDPYKIINGAMMSPFRVISQTDLFAANTRPTCTRKMDRMEATLTEERKAVLRGSWKQHGLVRRRGTERSFEYWFDLFS